jgi:hypothetical protein
MADSEPWHYKIEGLTKREKTAIEEALAQGFWPISTFTGVRDPWEVRCIDCETTLNTTFFQIRKRKLKCDICFPPNYDNEIKIMLDASLEPLEPYSGNGAIKWKSKCLKCGVEVSPRFYDVKRGKGGCKNCGSRAHLTASKLSEITKVMKDAKLEPLEPFVTTTHKWKCKCQKCGEIVSPTFHNVRRGHGGCIYCQVGAFKPLEPAYFYIMHHKEFASFKVGIGNINSVADRIKSHSKSGWTLNFKHSFNKGKDAIQVETEVLRWIRKDLNLPVHLTNEFFTHAGATETVSSDSISALEIQTYAENVIRKIEDKSRKN